MSDLLRRATIPALQHILEHLRRDSERLFGWRVVHLEVGSAEEREASTVFRVVARGGTAPGSVFFVKFYKPKELEPATVELTRARMLSDFEVSSRVHRDMASLERFAAPRPLACYPEFLALATVGAPGETLSDLLDHRAGWWPPQAIIRELGRAVSDVGGWLRAFQAAETRDGRFALHEMRKYIDVRLRRLLATNPPVLDAAGRERVLRYFDRTAARVEPDDLREVLTHGDLAPSNVLVAADRITVIDFAMAAPGGVFMDVARLYTQLEFLTAKPKFRPVVIRDLQQCLLDGFDPGLRPDRPLFRLFLLQHLLCHMSNITRNPAPALARLYNRHQLRLRKRWLQTFAA